MGREDLLDVVRGGAVAAQPGALLLAEEEVEGGAGVVPGGPQPAGGVPAQLAGQLEEFAAQLEGPAAVERLQPLGAGGVDPGDGRDA
ncbi:hypothetical protein ACFWXK_34845 [Streptomyces sp. NPDC059070]|uniref:hypothetical protein n=1 Tax=Streptomyces sp. NPDC059070 TaxID=3346713 RepID=UPI0036A180BC